MRIKHRLPPHEGYWLARNSHANPDISNVEYLHVLSKEEFNILSTAYKYFANRRDEQDVKPLFKAYLAWNQALDAAPGFAQLGPLPKEYFEDAFVTFVLVWRKTLDNLAFTISSIFGKDSIQYKNYITSTNNAFETYFGYRVVWSLRNIIQHEKTPPIEYSLDQHLYICEKCGQEHVDICHLSITLSCGWLETKCSTKLRLELEQLNSDVIDIGGVIEQSMQGFEDVLFAALLLTRDGPVYHTALEDIFYEINPDYPILVEYWHNEDGEPMILYESLSVVAWVIKRDSFQSS